jgi:hypothetical protein
MIVNEQDDRLRASAFRHPEIADCQDSLMDGYVRRLLRTNSTMAAPQATTQRPSKNP